MIAERVIGVSMMPGQMAHTWMPCSASSAFSDSLMPTTPNFDAEYGAMPGAATRPAIDAVFTIEDRPPCAIIRVTNARTTSARPSRFTPITRCQSSTVVCSISAAWPMPALLWSTSTRPSSSNTREANASTASGSVTSTTCACALPPISRATASADSPFTSATCTFAPSFANSSALARPIPEPAPVITTTLPANPGASMRPYASAVAPEPFTIDVADEVVDDLRERIRSMRWPDQIPGIGWNQGTELDYLRRTLDHWADGFDWRAQERELNSFAHFRAAIDGAGVHFVHERARDGRAGIPLLLQHGWPSSFVEYLRLVPLLTDSFDLVIPSLPGYGFSERPADTGVNYR